MKKSNLFLVILMALIVMSCSKDETTMGTAQEGNAIEFGTYVGRDAQTRAGVNNLTKLQGTGFGVWGYYTNGNNWATTNTPNFMWNQKVTYTDPSWVYTPVKYWPTTQGDKLTFFAYAPYESDPTHGANNGIVLSTNTDLGTPTITFTIKNDAANMVDLVTANAMNKTSSATPATVDFTFEHVLSRVNFEALALDETLSSDLAAETIINIKSVKLENSGEFYGSGKYTLTTETPAVTGVWSAPYTVATAPLDISHATSGIFNGVAASHGAKPASLYTDKGVQIASSTDAKSLFTENQYLFLIPKEGGLTADALKVTFTYDIVTADANLDLGYSKTSATKTVALPAGGLQTGKAYKYTFKFGVDRVVVGTVTVSDWENGTTPEVEIIDYTDTDVTP